MRTLQPNMADKQTKFYHFFTILLAGKSTAFSAR